jgi:hypothetical protein
MRRLARRLHRRATRQLLHPPSGLPIATPHIEVLRRPSESAQYTSDDYTQALDDHDVLASIGSVGDALDCDNTEAVELSLTCAYD